MSDKNWIENGRRKIYTTKKVGIKNSDPKYDLDVSGTIRTTNLIATNANIDVLNAKILLDLMV